MKRLRRFVIVLAVMLALMASGALYVWHRVRQVPEWYHPFALDAESQRKAANDVDNALINTYNAADVAQKQQRAKKNKGLPRTDLLIYFTEDELNSWAAKWEVRLHWKERLERHVQDPVLIFRDHHLILAGRSTEFNAIVSVHFAPRLEGGKLLCPIVSMTLGTLPIPQWLWSRFVGKLIANLERDLPALQRAAEINPHDGTANSEAVDAARSEFMLHMLRGEPSEPVLFIPQTLGHGGKSLTMQITRVDISNKTLTLQITPMEDGRREELLHTIKGPEGETIGMGKSGGNLK